MRLTLLLLLAVLSPLSAAQNDIKFKRITIEDGLSQSFVRAFCQDSQGFMWFGTADGLNRFDGYDFTVYRQIEEDSQSLSDKSVFAIIEDSGGRLWIGTRYGLNSFDPASNRFTRYLHDPSEPGSISGNTITALAEGGSGNIWIGTGDGGLDRLDRSSGSIKRYRLGAEGRGRLSDTGVSALFVDSGGILWVGTTNAGVHRYEEGKDRFTPFALELGGVSWEQVGEVPCFCEGRDGVMWIGTSQSGLVKYDTKSERCELLRSNPDDPRSLPNLAVRSIIIDSAGRLWVGTRNGLAVSDDGRGFLVYRNEPGDPDSLSYNNVEKLFEDRSGIVWISTMGYGLCNYAPNRHKFNLYRQNPSNPGGLSGSYLFSVIEDRSGVLWIGTYDGGLNSLDRGTGTCRTYALPTERENDARNNVILSLGQDGYGTILTGTWAGELFALLEGESEFKLIASSTDRISAIVALEDGTLAVAAASEGIFFIEPRGTGNGVEYTKTSETYRREDLALCRSLLEDHSRLLWVGTTNGLSVIDRRARRMMPFEEFCEGLTTGSRNVLSILEYPEGIYWFGTDEGLFRFDRNERTLRQITLKHGLPNNFIYGVLADNTGHLWVSTNRGLAKYDPEDESVEAFSISDGLQSYEFNLGASFKSTSGELFFGGINGLNSFFPEQIPRSRAEPIVALTSFKVFGEERRFDKPLSEVEGMVLGYDENFISLEFAALDYTDPPRNEYSYMMEGIDHDWAHSGSRRFVNYNLNPGSYVFRVIAANSDGVWNERGKSIEIVVLPPFWETWWFRILVVSGVLGLIVLFFSLRLINIRRQRDLLKKEVDIRTKDLQEKTEILEEQRKLLERRSRDLENINKELEAFSYRVSHDLRAPLRHIQGYGELLAGDYSGSLDAEGNILLKRLLESSDRMHELVEDLLELSRVTRQEMDKVPVDLSAIAKEIIKTLRESQPQRQVRITVAEDIAAEGDPGLLKIVLDNLLGNAWKYTGKREIAEIEFGARDVNGRRIYFVADNGTGFPMSKAGKLFEPFVRLHDSNEFPGTGVGLATVRRIIHRHGGSIWAESEPGMGTTFSFTLD